MTKCRFEWVGSPSTAAVRLQGTSFVLASDVVFRFECLKLRRRFVIPAGTEVDASSPKAFLKSLCRVAENLIGLHMRDGYKLAEARVAARRAAGLPAGPWALFVLQVRRLLA